MTFLRNLLVFNLIAAALVSTAPATVENRHLFPMGEKEAFLGNAGTALRGSAGSVIFNPGSLVHNKNSRISLSGSSFVYSELKLDRLARFDSTDLGFKSYGFNTVPTSMVSVLDMGNTSLALSIMVPAAFTLRNRVSWVTPNTNTTVVAFTDVQELWGGLTGS